MNKRQREVLEYIQRYTREHGFSPTVREIVDGTEFKSTSHVHQNINRLAAIGLLTFEPGKARTLRIVEPAEKEPQP